MKLEDWLTRISLIHAGSFTKTISGAHEAVVRDGAEGFVEMLE